MMSEERGWEDDYPEGSTGWIFNRKIDSIEKNSLKSGAIFLSVFVILLVIVTVEVIAGALYGFGPFFLWRMSIEPYNVALYNTVVFAVFLLIPASIFLYFGAKLIWHGWEQRRK
jgi:hypothetical protein